jgi:hypothetical protein
LAVERGRGRVVFQRPSQVWKVYLRKPTSIGRPCSIAPAGPILRRGSCRWESP